MTRVLVVVISIWAQALQAQEACVKPKQPDCVFETGILASSPLEERQHCMTAMRAYFSAAEAYQSCLVETRAEMIAAVDRELADLVGAVTGMLMYVECVKAHGSDAQLADIAACPIPHP